MLKKYIIFMAFSSRILVWMLRPFSRWWETVLLISWSWPSPAVM